MQKVADVHNYQNVGLDDCSPVVYIQSNLWTVQSSRSLFHVCIPAVKSFWEERRDNVGGGTYVHIWHILYVFLQLKASEKRDETMSEMAHMSTYDTFCMYSCS